MRRKSRHNICCVIPTEKLQGPQDMADGGSDPAERVRKIRNYLFSDLTWKREKKGYVKHIHMPAICIGVVYAYTHHLHMLYLYIC